VYPNLAQPADTISRPESAPATTKYALRIYRFNNAGQFSTTVIEGTMRGLSMGGIRRSHEDPTVISRFRAAGIRTTTLLNDSLPI